MRVTTLLENSSMSNIFKHAHGLSLLIESAGIKILFDTGPDDSFIYNANLLSEDLTEANYIVFSHGHVDHTGGLISILNLNRTAPVYIMSDANDMFYSKQNDMTFKDISMPIVDMNNPRYHLVDNKSIVSDSIRLIAVTRKDGFIPKANNTLYRKKNDLIINDDFSHELILCIKEEDGLIVFTGCSHSGIGNMLESVLQEFPKEKIKAVFGGMHLFNRSLQISEENTNILKLSEELSKYENCHFYTGHCTGNKAFKVLKSVFGEHLHHIKSGTVHTI